MKVKCGSVSECSWYFCLQLRLLSGVEEESEIVRQQEKTLKSELTLLRSKLANCETELLQCKNKIQ
jgi:Ras association domain-containing protein 7/8